MAKIKRWSGSYYLRQRTADKWGNKYNSPKSYRQTRTGYVVNSKGQFIGVEKPREHRFGYDPKKVRKPVTFVKPNRLGSLRSRRAHMRRL